MAVVWGFPTVKPVPTSYFWGIVLFTVLGSFSSTVQFVGMSAFHTQVSDPLIGGTYMTLLNTISNLGGTWPRIFVLKGVDFFSVATCKVKEETGDIIMKASECVSDHGKAACADLGGVCHTERDGYYIVSWICITLGASILLFYIWPTAKKLQALRQSEWRVNTFNHWKSVYERLVSTLDEFLAECSQLDSVLEQPGAYKWSGLEEALQYVDHTPALLHETWSSRMREAGAVLGTVRNRSKLLVPLNKLPSELIVYVLSMLDVDCATGHDPGTDVSLFPLTDVSMVSKQLRSITTSAPSLWIHVDFLIDGLNEAACLSHARSCLRYSRHQSLYVHAFDDKRTKHHSSAGIIASLAPHVHRIISVSLNVVSHLAKEILLGLFSDITSSHTRELFWDDPFWAYYNLAGSDAGPDFRDGALSGRLDGFLEALKVVEIRGPYLPLQHVAFRGLVILRLWASESVESPPTLAQFAGVLTACPELRVLRLIDIQFDTRSSVPIQAVFMPKLESLDLQCTPTNELLGLLSCVISGSDRFALGVWATPDMLEYETAKLSGIINQLNVTRLYFNCFWAEDRMPNQAPPLLTHVFPSVQELALRCYDYQPLVDIRPTDVSRFPSLHTLHLLGCQPATFILRSVIHSPALQVVYTDYIDSQPPPEAIPLVQHRSYPVVYQTEGSLDWPVDTFNRWKSVYERMVLNLDEFLAESSRLFSALDKPGAHNWSELEGSLKSIDSTLTSPDTWPLRIRDVRAVLGAVRNRSKSLVPLRKLPDEVVTYILSFLGTECIIKDISKERDLPLALAAVSMTSKWLRTTATSTSSLWTHFDIPMDGSNREAYMCHARSCLLYSERQYLYIDIFNVLCGYEKTRSRSMIALLAPHAHRIVSIGLHTTLRLAKETLLELFSHSTSPQTRELCLDGCDSGIDNSDVGFYNGVSDGRLDEFLKLLQIVRIRGPFLPLQSVIYRGLTILKISAYEMVAARPTIAEFTNILAAAPELRALVLVCLEFDTSSNTLPKPVFMSNLELLDLREIATSELLGLLSCIITGSTKLALSVMGDPDMLQDETARLHEFVNRSNVTRLLLQSPYSNRHPPKSPPLLLTHVFPTVQELALYDYVLKTLIDRRPVDMSRFPSLHTLHLLQCRHTTDSLHSVVHSSAIRVIYTDDVDCEPLSEASPSVEYRSYSTIYEGDGDLEWPLML
ncbi:hypothetical protein FRC09_008484 [Ceratobasidium sp. 395]|nr:hypothetical protein FRC09_008484 [Ceratobasidium sp. 395]